MKFLEGISYKTLKTMGISLLLIVATLGIMVSVQPLLVAHNQRTAEAEAVRIQKETIEANLERYASLQEYVTELNETTDFLVAKFPPIADPQNFIEQVYLAAEATGITANQITGINASTPTQVAVTGGTSGEAVCSVLEPGDVLRIVPDPQQALKAGNSRNKYYVLCFEDYVTRISNNSFYNAATTNAARQCNFSTDVREGTIIYLEVSRCEEGVVVPAVAAETVTIRDSRTRIPPVDTIGNVETALAQIGFTITLNPQINVNQLAVFVNNLYKMDRAVTIISIQKGSSNATTIKGFIYSHSSPTRLDGNTQTSTNEQSTPDNTTVQQESNTVEPGILNDQAEGEE